MAAGRRRAAPVAALAARLPAAPTAGSPPRSARRCRHPRAPGRPVCRGSRQGARPPRPRASRRAAARARRRSERPQAAQRTSGSAARGRCTRRRDPARTRTPPTSPRRRREACAPWPRCHGGSSQSNTRRVAPSWLGGVRRALHRRAICARPGRRSGRGRRCRSGRPPRRRAWTPDRAAPRAAAGGAASKMTASRAVWAVRPRLWRERRGRRGRACPRHPCGTSSSRRPNRA
mmetsp:Transcript_19167/g.44057  ORF Transcript_19167/g.44057 Transcript_19167/m.44057 type:complete len:232 (-) Transcript_19167:27-722(-)